MGTETLLSAGISGQLTCKSAARRKGRVGPGTWGCTPGRVWLTVWAQRTLASLLPDTPQLERMGKDGRWQAPTLRRKRRAFSRGGSREDRGLWPSPWLGECAAGSREAQQESRRPCLQPPLSISGTALWALVGAGGPDVDELRCQPSGPWQPSLPQRQKIASAWRPAHTCRCDLRPQCPVSCRRIFGADCLPPW